MIKHLLCWSASAWQRVLEWIIRLPLSVQQSVRVRIAVFPPLICRYARQVPPRLAPGRWGCSTVCVSPGTMVIGPAGVCSVLVWSSVPSTVRFLYPVPWAMSATPQRPSRFRARGAITARCSICVRVGSCVSVIGTLIPYPVSQEPSAPWDLTWSFRALVGRGVRICQPTPHRVRRLSSALPCRFVCLLPFF